MLMGFVLCGGGGRKPNCGEALAREACSLLVNYKHVPHKFVEIINVQNLNVLCIKFVLSVH